MLCIRDLSMISKDHIQEALLVLQSFGVTNFLLQMLVIPVVYYLGRVR